VAVLGPMICYRALPHAGATGADCFKRTDREWEDLRKCMRVVASQCQGTVEEFSTSQRPNRVRNDERKRLAAASTESGNELTLNSAPVR